MAEDDLFSQLSNGSYDGMEFPVVEVTAPFGSAAAFHKFPHRPGQKIELTGREPVVGSMTIALFNNLHAWNGNNDDLWPGTAQFLRERAQRQQLGTLVVPTFGTIDRALIKYTEHYPPGTRNGCMATIDFQEDNSDDISVGEASARSMLSDLANTDLDKMTLSVSLMKLKALKLPSPRGGMDIFEALGRLGAMIDQLAYDLTGPMRLAAQIDNAIAKLLKSSEAFGEAVNYDLTDVLLNIRDVTQRAVSEALEKFSVKRFVAAADTTLSAVASAASNTMEEVMRLNPGVDPLDVPVGTVLIVLKK
jgi:LysM repeat protein